MQGESMPSATLTSKGQVKIPVEVRNELRLTSGSRIDFQKNEDGDYMIRPKRSSIMDLEGILTRMGYSSSETAPTIEEMDQAIADLLIENDEHSLSDEAKALLGNCGPVHGGQ
jgi:AbrB family looped-hinge helix DNA binding protein